MGLERRPSFYRGSSRQTKCVDNRCSVYTVVYTLICTTLLVGNFDEGDVSFPAIHLKEIQWRFIFWICIADFFEISWKPPPAHVHVLISLFVVSRKMSARVVTALRWADEMKNMDMFSGFIIFRKMMAMQSPANSDKNILTFFPLFFEIFLLKNINEGHDHEVRSCHNPPRHSHHHRYITTCTPTA